MTFRRHLAFAVRGLALALALAAAFVAGMSGAFGVALAFLVLAVALQKGWI